MRVLSFIPALLLSAASFVAAAPASTSALMKRDDSAVQSFTTIIQEATTKLQAFGSQLSNMESNPSADQFSAVVVQITATLDATVNQIQGVVAADITVSVNLTELILEITALLNVVVGLVISVTAIVLKLGVQVAGSLETTIAALLHSVLALVASLGVYVVGATGAILQIVLSTVQAVVQLAVGVEASLGIVISLS